jgi:hypothetical protein
MTSPAQASFNDTEIQLTRSSLAGSGESQVKGSEKARRESSIRLEACAFIILNNLGIDSDNKADAYQIFLRS